MQLNEAQAADANPVDEGVTLGAWATPKGRNFRKARKGSPFDDVKEPARSLAAFRALSLGVGGGQAMLRARRA